MKFTIEPLGAVAGYVDFVARVPEAMVMFSPTWLALIQCTAGGDGFILTAREQGRIVAVLPYFISPDKGMGRVLNSLPFFGSSAGVLVHPGFAENEIIGEMVRMLVDEAHRCQCRSLTLISSLLDSDAKNQAYRDMLRPDHTDARIGQAAMIDCTAEQLLNRFTPCKRNNVRNALRQGVQVRESSAEEDWEWAIGMHEVRMNAIGGSPKPPSFKTWGFNAIRNDPNCRLTIADLAGQRCAGLLTIEHGRFTEYAFPVSDWDLKASKGLFLLIYESMQHSICSGRQIYNFGGTWKDQIGLHKFKQSLSAKDFMYYHYIKVLDKAIYRSTSAELLNAFPLYYVVPFDALIGER